MTKENLSRSNLQGQKILKHRENSLKKPEVTVGLIGTRNEETYQLDLSSRTHLDIISLQTAKIVRIYAAIGLSNTYVDRSLPDALILLRKA